jgi:iron complex outermembrane receptor protein
MLFTRKPIAVAIAFALPAFWQSASAQTTVKEPQVLNEVSVTASKITDTPTPSALDKASLDSLRPATSDTASLLRDVPGMSLYGAGGVSSLPVIHGMADDRVRTKVDGMDLISACGNHMNSPLSYIDPTNVGRVKVFAGITPVSVGGDSIGGTIIVNSADPVFAKAGEGPLFQGEAGAFYRSNGNGYGGNVVATLANENISLTYTGSSAQSDNYKSARKFKPSGAAATGRGWIDGDEVGSTAYHSINQTIGLALRNENHLVDFKVGFQNIPEQGFPNQRMDMTDNDATFFNLRYKGSYQWGNLESRLYHEHTRHSMNFGPDKQYWYGDAPGMPMETRGKNTGLTVKADIPLNERDILRTGIDLQNYRLNDWWPPSGSPGMMGMMAPNTFQNINDGKRDRYDVFGEWEANWTKQWTSLLGLRYSTVRMDTGDVQGYSNGNGGGMHNYLSESTAFNARNHERTDHNVDVTALARYTPNDNQTYEAGYARKGRSPNLYERYTWSTSGMSMIMVNMVGDGNGYVGNLDLKPETANTVSATADWHDATKELWGLRVTPYYTYVNDYIDARRCTGPMMSSCAAASQTATNKFVLLQYTNQDARLYGADISGFFPLAKGTGFGNFTVRGLLNYVNGKNKKTDDDLYNIMPINAKLALEQKFGNWTNIAEGHFVGAKDNVSDVRNEIKTSGYSLFNLRSSYDWKPARIDFGIENVFDKQYRLPLGGAYTGQGATMGTNSIPWGNAVPGMGRSFYAGVNYKF